MKATIKDVAREAKVSTATVSFVVNGIDKVKKNTKERVLLAIQKLNYVPDQAARTMIKKKTKTVGLIVPLLTNEYWAELAEHIQEELILRGYTLMICTAGMKSAELTINSLLERNVDGVILGGRIVSDPEDHYIQMFMERRIPLVSIAPIHKDVTSVWGDNLNSSREVVEHLIQQGHMKIAYIGCISTGIGRELGYRNALAIAEIPIDEALVRNGKSEEVHNFSQYGYRTMKQLVADKCEFTALFGANDLIAIGAIKALQESGLQVPHDVAVAGFDDIAMAALYSPAITTVKQPIGEMAGSVVAALIEQIEQPDGQAIARKITFPMTVVVRESSISPKGGYKN
jgi:DNA-binding LacI/PurR family transcriptional regulator